MAVNAVKLGHDCEQIEYLLGLGRLPAAYGEVLEDYRALLAEVRDRVGIDGLLAFDAARHPLVARTYKRPVYIDPAPAPEPPLVNPALDWSAAERRYLESRPHVVVVDDLLAAVRLLQKRHLVCVASLRETSLDEALDDDVRDLQGAIHAGAVARYLEQRTAAHDALRSHRVMMLDVTADELPAALVERYLAVKRDGVL